MTALIVGCGNGDPSASQQVSAGSSEAAASERASAAENADSGSVTSKKAQSGSGPVAGSNRSESGPTGPGGVDVDSILDCAKGSSVEEQVGEILPSRFDLPGTPATPEEAIAQFRRVESKRSTAFSRSRADFRYERSSQGVGVGNERAENPGRARFVGLREDGSVAITVGVKRGGETGSWLVFTYSQCDEAPRSGSASDRTRGGAS